MNLAKFSFAHRNLFFISKYTISSLNYFFTREKKNLLPKYGVTNFLYHNEVALTRGNNVYDGVLKNSVLLNESIFMSNLEKKSQEKSAFERPQQVDPYACECSAWMVYYAVYLPSDHYHDMDHHGTM
ncbi:hypothetical protein C922_04095 [Plasmodium inui San Antonio 1]|uniref:Uncharacterized protein n=1 Tax=Plasmodium inui San Antonio 1 TaxID=1237626 RepID=W7A8Y2_9APIC|nr:hypothetical protein C922_04095 [Plasmodium inui San Antonio 1]EUD65589.1 hypothetical protein C922_04095 [Plasmodium inui San Antonio 1]